MFQRNQTHARPYSFTTSLTRASSPCGISDIGHYQPRQFKLRWRPSGQYTGPGPDFCQVMDSFKSITAHNRLAVLINAQLSQDYSQEDFTNMQANATIQPLAQPQGPKPVCTACQEECRPESFIAACQDTYCNDCLVSYVNSALEPGGTFPPICCDRPLTLQLLETYIPSELLYRYQAKQASIKEACSLICAEPGCCLIIEEKDIDEDVGHCLTCKRYTCRKCRNAQHRGKACPTDAEQEKVFILAKEKGWQPCYQCNNMIERNFGCNHMT